MKFETINDMYKYHKSITSLRNYIDKRLYLMYVRMIPQEYIQHVILDRDVYIDGFKLSELDQFEEGYNQCMKERGEYESSKNT